jgi:tetratricopeptide (TPR) repeat protein
MVSSSDRINWDAFWYGDPDLLERGEPKVSKIIPQILAALASFKPAKWVGALDWMKWNFLAIGEPHPAFVSCLLPLLRNPQTRCRGRILDWLAWLAQTKQVFVKEKRGNVLAKTRASIWKGLGVFLDLLADERASVRTSAPYTLCMLALSAGRHIPPRVREKRPKTRIVKALLGRLDVETDALPKASVVLALGMFARKNARLLPRLRRTLADDHQPAVRMATALALAVCDPELPEEARQLLTAEVRAGHAMMTDRFDAPEPSLEARHNPLVIAYEKLGLAIADEPAAKKSADRGAYEDVWFPWTDADWPVVSPVQALCQVKGLERDGHISTMTQAISRCEDYEAGEILPPIFKSLFVGKRLGKSFTPADMTPGQRAVLRAVYDNPLLWPAVYTYDAFAAVGLPEDRAAWRQLLKIKERMAPAAYCERLVRSVCRLDASTPLTEAHYAQVEELCLYDEADDRFIPFLARFPNLENLEIGNTRDLGQANYSFTQKGFNQFPILPRLTGLVVEKVPITDIPNIENLPALEGVSVAYTAVSDRFVHRLRGMPNLCGLVLHSTKVTDACLQDVATLRRLTDLDVAYTELTDAAVAVLCRLKRLTDLNIAGTRISPKGHEKISKALPKCNVCHDDHLELIQTYLDDDDYRQALKELNQAIEFAPENSEYHGLRGWVREQLGQYASAKADYERAVLLQENVDTLNDLAWILATAPSPSMRDVPRSLELALRACRAVRAKDAEVCDTLAAAYANSGQFGKAVTWQEKAIRLCEDKVLKKERRDRLKLYRAGQPYRLPTALRG